MPAAVDYQQKTRSLKEMYLKSISLIFGRQKKDPHEQSSKEGDSEIKDSNATVFAEKKSKPSRLIKKVFKIHGEKKSLVIVSTAEVEGQVKDNSTGSAKTKDKFIKRVNTIFNTTKNEDKCTTADDKSQENSRVESLTGMSKSKSWVKRIHHSMIKRQKARIEVTATSPNVTGGNIVVSSLQLPPPIDFEFIIDN